MRVRTLCLGVALAALGCETPAPSPTPPVDAARDGTTDLAPEATSDAAPDASPDGPQDTAPEATLDVPADALGDALGDVPRSCMPRPDDYRLPRTGAWMPCVSDRGMYVRFSTSTSTVARVEAFERMHRDPTLGRTAGFFDPLRDPSPEEFTAARMIYLEAEGLDSRVSRRSDEHYPAPMVNDCRMDAVRMANPDYCVGPSRLLPVLTEAFRLGQTAAGTVPSRVHAARIEAALLWFLYLSPYKESLTCTTTTADCDSAWAYYTGGAPPDAPMQLGLARRVAALEPATHLRIFDGLLAVRCWRDLDGAATATDTALRDRARAQLDRALTRGMVAVVLARLEALAVATGPEALAQRAFLSTLAPLLERPVLAAGGGEVVRDGLRALAGEGALSPAQLRALARALDQSTPCP